MASPPATWDHYGSRHPTPGDVMTIDVDHNLLDQALKRSGSNWGAAQAHGLLSARLAVADAAGAGEWLAQILEGTDSANALRAETEALLNTLFETTHRQLSRRQSEFVPLLPDDSEDPATRASALAEWCEGFLHGLVASDYSQSIGNSSGNSLRERLAAEPLADIIRDLLQMTRAAADDQVDDETNESAYAELVEYLRVAAQLAYEELAELRAAADADAAPPPLH